MAYEEKIEKITKVDRALDAEKSPLGPVSTPDKAAFDSLMNKTVDPTAAATTVAPVASPDKAQANSLLDEVRILNYKGTATPKAITPSDLADQTRGLIAQIDAVKEKLSNPDIPIKDSVQKLMDNKLVHMDESLRIALSKLGLEGENVENPEKATTTRPNPIEKFLGLLTDGQARLSRLGDELQAMSVLSSKEINPAMMLTVQMKMNQIQQEVELFGGLLNKSLESLKTIMNIQV